MGLIVQKFGGTSVANTDRIRTVAKRVACHYQRHKQIVVVVSAMAGTTDHLVELCNDIDPSKDNSYARERDFIISTGEQITAGLLAMELRNLGVNACSFNGEQIGIQTNEHYGKARILDIRTDNIRTALEAQTVVVVPGFQGRTSDKSTTTLGRGGSDTTAVALAAALSADECQIFTDVDGIYTTDPKIEPKARRLKSIMFEEMLEMASLGSKVLQTRSVEFAGKYRVPLRVLSSLIDYENDDAGGTMITYEDDITMEEPIITGIAINRSEAKVTIAGVPDTPGIAYRLLEDIAKENINVDMIVQNIGSEGRTDFSFTVPRDDIHRAKKRAEKSAREVQANDVITSSEIAKISLVGIGMKSHAGVACKMFRVLAENSINIVMISTSEIKISVIVDESVLEKAVSALHDAFELDKELLITNK